MSGSSTPCPSQCNSSDWRGALEAAQGQGAVTCPRDQVRATIMLVLKLQHREHFPGESSGIFSCFASNYFSMYLSFSRNCRTNSLSKIKTELFSYIVGIKKKVSLSGMNGTS